MKATRCLSWLQGLAGGQRRPRRANSPGPQNVGAPLNHSRSSLQRESDIRAALARHGGWRQAQGSLSTSNMLEHRPD